jgi:predicted RNase H-like HicB family nuclease
MAARPPDLLVWFVSPDLARHHQSMDRIELEVFSTATNHAVVRVPGRRFPGAVVQGDTLSALLRNAEQILRELRAGRSPVDETEELTEALRQLLGHYERTLIQHDLPLPYMR